MCECASPSHQDSFVLNMGVVVMRMNHIYSMYRYWAKVKFLCVIHQSVRFTVKPLVNWEADMALVW